ncbi:RNA polymerase sigma factor (sigma-70 family) [Labedaea rhizosphaerae]|uniref:RNA polymerase sigma factor (Sigma-70 family) n=1 Tax=Labedaea rhizosphaerae TaxID=598644 RepID=A0A4R6SNU9_LABRH|nr:RNA polymerase sigma factor (sigma-70 family) [Labedaea rhizosphaerae]
MTGVDRAASGVSRDRDDERVVDLAAGGSNTQDPAALDRALLARLRAGEDAAFGELFSRHADAVRRLARGLAADRAEAEDLVAEAFFRVLQAIRRGSGPVDNVRGYLLIVVRRVAWEWSLRRKDVLVPDDELTNRPDQHDAVGQSAERHLIVRAFSSLPERWRSVLWKVEVEGERPAVVAMNFGLSPNATAALARRARQGLRAAYLQAHLAVDRSATGCRSVLEKLGAYTAGSIKGSERRRIHTHLGGCSDCRRTHDELREVCSGLRAHAGALIVPVGAGLAATKGGGLAAGLKGLLGGIKLKTLVAASSAAVVGAVGIAVGPALFHGKPVASHELDDDNNLRITTHATTTSLPSVALPTGALSTALVAPASHPEGSGAPGSSSHAAADPTETVVLTESSVPDGTVRGDDNYVVYGETTVYRATVVDAYGTQVQETTVVTEVNRAGQTTSYTTTQMMTVMSAEEPTLDAATGTPTTPITSTQSATPTTLSGKSDTVGTSAPRKPANPPESTTSPASTPASPSGSAVVAQ